MSVSASIMGTVVFLLGKIKRIPRRVICVLWAVPFFRMWVPVGLNSKFSLMSLLSGIAMKTVTVYDGEVDFSMMNFVMGAESYSPFAYKSGLLRAVFSAAVGIWAVVALAMVMAMAILYWVTKSELKDAACVGGNVYTSHKITAPAVYGIFRPRILLPAGQKEADLPYVLRHEKAHVRRLDNLWRVAGIVTACVHWFNPLSWVFLKSFLAGLELACDESVLAELSQAERKEYAMTLLGYAESKSLYASAFGGAKVRVRIERILSYKKLSAFSACALAVFAITVGYILLTNAG